MNTIRSSGFVWAYDVVVAGLSLYIVALDLKGEGAPGEVAAPVLALAVMSCGFLLWRLLGRSCSFVDVDTLRIRGFWRTYVVPHGGVEAVLFVPADWGSRTFNWSWVVVQFQPAQGETRRVVVSANRRLVQSEKKAHSVGASMRLTVREQARPIPGRSEFSYSLSWAARALRHRLQP